MFEAELDVCRWGTKSLEKARRTRKSAEEQVSLVVTLSNREGAGGFSKQKRESEREPRTMMMTGNKRGVEPYAKDDDGEQMSRAVR